VVVDVPVGRTDREIRREELKNDGHMPRKRPGDPAEGCGHGVETATGRLGHGISNAIGRAAAEKILDAQVNRDGHNVGDHYTYTFLGDGCLMEGISHEVCSLAGTLGLGKLIAFYDDNGISIDGEVEGWFTDDTPKRFESYGWQVIANVDGHDSKAIKAAIEAARAETDKPTIICCKTIIGFGSPNKQGTESCHGAALGHDEIALTREALNWQHALFVVPEDIYKGWDAKVTGNVAEKEWNATFDAYAEAHPALDKEFTRSAITYDLPADYSDNGDVYMR